MDRRRLSLGKCAFVALSKQQDINHNREAGFSKGDSAILGDVKFDSTLHAQNSTDMVLGNTCAGYALGTALRYPRCAQGNGCTRWQFEIWIYLRLLDCWC